MMSSILNGRLTTFFPDFAAGLLLNCHSSDLKSPETKLKKGFKLNFSGYFFLRANFESDKLNLTFLQTICFGGGDERKNRIRTQKLSIA